MLCAITGTQLLNRKGFWQTEGIPVDGQKPFFLHFAQLIGQGAAVYFQIVGQLLAVEWNGDFQASFSAAWSERYEITLARMDLGEVWRMRLERLKFFRAETIRRFWIIWLWWGQEFWQVHSRCAISRNRTVQAEAAVALTPS